MQKRKKAMLKSPKAREISIPRITRTLPLRHTIRPLRPAGVLGCELLPQKTQNSAVERLNTSATPVDLKWRGLKWREKLAGLEGVDFLALDVALI